MHAGSTRPPKAHRPYCLRCYAEMERFEGASLPCARCGFVNVRRDQEAYWTKEPRFVELEAYAKIVVVFLLIGLCALMVFGLGRRASYGLGQGWAVAFPILLGVILWDTASGITRRSTDHRVSIVWRVVCAVLAPWPFLLAVDLNPWARPGDLRIGAGAFLALLLVGLLLAAGALGLGALGRSVTRWRESRIRAAQERARAATQSA